MSSSASTVSTTTTTTTVPPNTTSVTKSKEQILIQSSGAMIAVIVLGIIIILAVALIILKTYNRRTHASRILGSKPRPKTSQSTVNGSSLPLNSMGVSSVSGSIIHSNPALENGFQLPSGVEGNPLDQFSSTSDYSESVVTIHDAPSAFNT